VVLAENTAEAVLDTRHKIAGFQVSGFRCQGVSIGHRAGGIEKSKLFSFNPGRTDSEEC
jgi:hypothetical protein